jgi:ABC-type bacteriocin/lantibiotic exporter with double-glycine peptidase domain
MRFRTFSQLYRIVTMTDVKSFWAMIFTCTLTSIFEALGVFSVMPFIGAISNPGLLDRFRQAPVIGLGLSGLNDSELIFSLGIAVVIITWSVSAISALSNARLLKFSYSHEKILAELLFRRYLTLPYQDYSTRDASELGKNVLHETHRLIHGVLVPWLNLISRFFSGFALIALLLAISWKATVICALVIGTAYWAAYRMVREPLRKNGEASTKANTNRYQIVTEALSGLKEVQHYALETRFLSLFSEQVTAYVRALTRCDTAALLPKYMFDAVVVTVAVAAILVVSERGEITAQLPVISVFALAVYRLMPLFHQIFNSLAVIRFNESSLMIVADEAVIPSARELEAKQVSLKDGMDHFHDFVRIQFQNVTYCYPSSQKAALNDISIDIPGKGLVCIAGQSGSGKSTLLDLMAGAIVPKDGVILVNGNKLQEQNIEQWRAITGLASQHAPLFLGTVRNNVVLWGRGENEDDAWFEQCMRMAALDLTFLQDEESLVIGSGGRSVSGGQRQRISIARALYRRPKLLLLDEPTSALDRRAALHIIQDLVEISKSILVVVVSHDEWVVKRADKVIFVNEGRIDGIGAYTELARTNSGFAELLVKQ